MADKNATAFGNNHTNQSPLINHNQINHSKLAHALDHDRYDFPGKTQATSIQLHKIQLPLVYQQPGKFR